MSSPNNIPSDIVELGMEVWETAIKFLEERNGKHFTAWKKHENKQKTILLCAKCTRIELIRILGRIIEQLKIQDW